MVFSAFIKFLLVLFFICFTIADNLFASKINFFSTKFNEVNVRNGPGLNHLILYKILIQGYPLRVIDEFEGWKRVIDFKGRQGWVSNTQISKKRYVITVNPDQYLYKFPKFNSKKIALIKNETILRIVKVIDGWVMLESEGIKGWVYEDFIWGIN